MIAVLDNKGTAIIVFLTQRQIPIVPQTDLKKYCIVVESMLYYS